MGRFFTWFLDWIIGRAFYTGSRLFLPEEERLLSNKFGTKWDKYSKSVKLPWL